MFAMGLITTPTEFSNGTTCNVTDITDTFTDGATAEADFVADSSIANDFTDTSRETQELLNGSVQVTEEI